MDAITKLYISKQHGTKVGQQIADLAKTFLADDYDITTLNDYETVTQMMLVLNAIDMKLITHWNKYPFKK